MIDLHVCTGHPGINHQSGARDDDANFRMIRSLMILSVRRSLALPRLSISSLSSFILSSFSRHNITSEGQEAWQRIRSKDLPYWLWHLPLPQFHRPLWLRPSPRVASTRFIEHAPSKDRRHRPPPYFDACTQQRRLLRMIVMRYPTFLLQYLPHP